ncbi:MAG: cytochrome c3 family protein [Pirellulales bacterium]
MRTITHSKSPMWVPRWGLVVVGLISLGMASCQSSHEPTVSTDPNLVPGWPRANPSYVQVSYQEVKAELPKVAGAEYVKDDEVCTSCHGAYAKTFGENVHRNNGCESCHGPASKHLETRGKEPGLIFSFKKGNPAVLAEACLQCHEQDPCSAGAQWRTSKHAACGVTCVSCHRAHYNVPQGTPATTEPSDAATSAPAGNATLTNFQAAAGAQTAGPDKKNLPSLRGSSNNLGAVAPGLCYRCHTDKTDLQRIAGPHQICGPNGFNCTTCHDPHGHIKESTRKDLCLSCHNGTPTMAWHSSSHERNGVACTDCHNPHPSACVPQLVQISHYQVQRPTRMPMSVWEPEACYKCHPKIFALNSLPSHHPIKEGKMVCSDCHDPHGQREANLKGETINLVCYKCHAEKQGPFAYTHSPVTENCDYCHEPHGTVANNLLRQPVTFLCLRCHVGHRNGEHGGTGSPGNYVPGTGRRVNIDKDSAIRQAIYTECTACHTQIHGSDVPTIGHDAGFLMR